MRGASVKQASGPVVKARRISAGPPSASRQAVGSRRMLTTTSSFGHSETATRLRDAISQAGMTLFAQFDHAAGARDAGMELADEVVLVFGNPHAGTMLMQADPRVGVELPLRMLVWSQGGQTLVGYNDPKELAA